MAKKATVKRTSKKPVERSVRSLSKPTSKEADGASKQLSGSNPQNAKGDGNGPMQQNLEALAGWKRDVGVTLDQLIVRTLPNVRKAVRWNTPFYGIEGQGWFLGFHCITKYMKVAFLNGGSLKPLPPVESKQPSVRYFHIYDGDVIDEDQFADWLRQAAELPGDRCF